MKKYLSLAAKAWAKATLNIQKFANAYVEAVGEFREAATEEFKFAFPMFGEREWRRLTLIGNGELLPQFFFKSDFFVGKLLKMNSSMRIQKALVGASNDGRIRVDRGNGPEKVTLSDLTSREDKALVMLLSEENEKLSPGDLRSKFRMLVAKINKSNRHSSPVWELRVVKGRTVAHFNRACNMEREDLEDVLSAVKRGHECVGPTRPSSEILAELVKAVKELNDMRDVEWDFAEECGHDSSMWTDKDESRHEWIINSIQAYRENVQRLAREATGDKDFEIELKQGE